jgi:hypothetical protein
MKRRPKHKPARHARALSDRNVKSNRIQRQEALDPYCGSCMHQRSAHLVLEDRRCLAPHDAAARFVTHAELLSPETPAGVGGRCRCTGFTSMSLGNN